MDTLCTDIERHLADSAVEYARISMRDRVLKKSWVQPVFLDICQAFIDYGILDNATRNGSSPCFKSAKDVQYYFLQNNLKMIDGSQEYDIGKQVLPIIITAESELLLDTFQKKVFIQPKERIHDYGQPHTNLDCDFLSRQQVHQLIALPYLRQHDFDTLYDHLYPKGGIVIDPERVDYHMNELEKTIHSLHMKFVGYVSVDQGINITATGQKSLICPQASAVRCEFERLHSHTSANKQIGLKFDVAIAESPCINASCTFGRVLQINVSSL